jgi:hypothetical protein
MIDLAGDAGVELVHFIRDRASDEVDDWLVCHRLISFLSKPEAFEFGVHVKIAIEAGEDHAIALASAD